MSKGGRGALFGEKVVLKKVISGDKRIGTERDVFDRFPEKGLGNLVNERALNLKYHEIDYGKIEPTGKEIEFPENPEKRRFNFEPGGNRSGERVLRSWDNSLQERMLERLEMEERMVFALRGLVLGWIGLGQERLNEMINH